MNDQTRKRVIGLAVLIVVVFGLTFVLSSFFGPQNKSMDSSTMRQITIETNPSGGSEATANDNAKTGVPDFADTSSSGASPNRGNEKENHTELIVGNSGTTPSNDGTVTDGTVRAESSGKDSQIAAMPDQSPARQSTADNARQTESQSVSHKPRRKSRHKSRENERQVANATASHDTASEATGNKGGPESAEKSAGGAGEWVVQVASFKTLEQAKTFISHMDNQYASFYSVGEVKGTTYYRVRVGPFVNKNKAERIADELATGNRKPYAMHR